MTHVAEECEKPYAEGKDLLSFQHWLKELSVAHPRKPLWARSSPASYPTLDLTISAPPLVLPGFAPKQSKAFVINLANLIGNRSLAPDFCFNT